MTFLEAMKRVADLSATCENEEDAKAVCMLIDCIVVASSKHDLAECYALVVSEYSKGGG